MLPFVLGLDAVIPPTCVPFTFGPFTVTKYDRISVLASHDTNCALTVLEHSTANSVLSSCGVTDVRPNVGKSWPASGPRNKVRPVKMLSAASIACFHASMKTWSLFWYAALLGNEC